MSKGEATLRERDIQSAVLDYLKLHRIFHWRNNTGAVKIGKRFFRYGYPGSPDIIAVMGGRFIGIELKAPKKKQTEEQIEFQENLTAARGIYILARSVEDVITGLDIP